MVSSIEWIMPRGHTHATDYFLARPVNRSALSRPCGLHASIVVTESVVENARARALLFETRG